AGYFKTYSLRLQSDFGDGLIRQSEFRTVSGGNATYFYKVRPEFSVLTGLDLRRDAPRDLALSKADENGRFQLVTSNDVTIASASSFGWIDGSVTRYFRYDLGLRRDEVSFDNKDKLDPANSFHRLTGITTPKGTLTLLPPGERLPEIAFSYGQAFHTNDP